MEKKNNKKAIIITCVIIGIIAAVVAISTYAFWQVSKSQSDTNDIVAMCLDINLSSDDTGLSITNAWPTSDEDGLQNAPVYTFSVTNNCEKAKNYTVGIKTLLTDFGDDGSDDMMDTYAVKVALDGATIGTLGNNSKSVSYVCKDGINSCFGSSENTIGFQFDLKDFQIAGSTGSKKSVNTHKLQLWVDENADISNQSKMFTGRVTITSAPNQNEEYAQATREECFQMTDDGKIYGYDATCGTNVVIPNTINGKAVKTIGQDAFKNVTYLGDIGCNDSGETSSCVIVNSNYYSKKAELQASYPTRKFYLLTDVGVPDEYYQYGYKFDDSGSIDFTKPNSTQECIEYLKNGRNGCVKNENTMSLKVDKVDFSNIKNLETIEAWAFSVPSPGSTVGNTGISDVKFGVHNVSATIKSFAFSGIKTNTLVLYPFKSMAEDAFNKTYAYYKAEDVVIDNLIIKSGISSAGDCVGGDCYQSNKVNMNFDFPIKNVVIEEGIKEINKLHFDNVYNATVSLPSTLNYIDVLYGTTINVNKEKYDSKCHLSIEGISTSEANSYNWLPSTKTCP